MIFKTVSYNAYKHRSISGCRPLSVSKCGNWSRSLSVSRCMNWSRSGSENWSGAWFRSRSWCWFWSFKGEYDTHEGFFR